MRQPRFRRILGVILLTPLGLSCDVRVHPIRDALAGAGGSTGGDAAIGFCPPDALVGYASLASADNTYSTTTGGGSSTPVVVDASDSDAITQFKTYADRKSGAAVIQIKGMIGFAGFSDHQVRVASNTTVIGADDRSGFTGGGLDLAGNSNIIIKNLVIAKAVGTDAISIQGPSSTNIWIDHCDLSSELNPDGTSYDGLVDITHAAELVTISWTVFHDHDDTGIIGHSDLNVSEDYGHLHVTYDHDLFRNVNAGPRVRFGNVHVFDVFFDHVAYYGVASTMMATVLVENDYFTNVTPVGQDPAYGPVTTKLTDSMSAGSVELTGSYFDATDGPNVIMGNTSTWTPPYPYTADQATSARTLTTACAGPRPIPGAP